MIKVCQGAFFTSMFQSPYFSTCRRSPALHSGLAGASEESGDWVLASLATQPRYLLHQKHADYTTLVVRNRRKPQKPTREPSPQTNSDAGSGTMSPSPSC